MAHVERRRRKGQIVWRARYRAPDGRERSKTFRRRADAERFLTTVEASKLRGDWIDPVRGRITYREWSARYLAHALHKRPTTLARDHSVTEKHLLPAIGERRLASLTPLDIRRVVQQMSETLSPASVRTDYAVLRAILNAAVEAEILAVSPCRGVRLPARHEPSGELQDVPERAGSCVEVTRAQGAKLAVEEPSLHRLQAAPPAGSRGRAPRQPPSLEAARRPRRVREDERAGSSPWRRSRRD